MRNSLYLAAPTDRTRVNLTGAWRSQDREHRMAGDAPVHIGTGRRWRSALLMVARPPWAHARRPYDLVASHPRSHSVALAQGLAHSCECARMEHEQRRTPALW